MSTRADPSGPRQEASVSHRTARPVLWRVRGLLLPGVPGLSSDTRLRVQTSQPGRDPHARSRPAGPRERAQRLADASPCEPPWGGRSQRPGWGPRARAASAAGRRGGRGARPRGQPLGRRARGLRVRSRCSSPDPGRRRGDTAQGLKGAAALHAVSQRPLGQTGSPKADCEGRRPRSLVQGPSCGRRTQEDRSPLQRPVRARTFLPRVCCPRNPRVFPKRRVFSPQGPVSPAHLAARRGRPQCQAPLSVHITELGSARGGGPRAQTL